MKEATGETARRGASADRTHRGHRLPCIRSDIVYMATVRLGMLLRKSRTLPQSISGWLS